MFAFIGTSEAADDIHKSHPKPHRLHVCLGLEAKNPGIILPDADLKVAVNECVLGTCSYNGQRCTALKILLVHESIAEAFLKKFCEAVDNLKMGLPWEEGVKITPLPEENKPGYLGGESCLELLQCHFFFFGQCFLFLIYIFIYSIFFSFFFFFCRAYQGCHCQRRDYCKCKRWKS